MSHALRSVRVRFAQRNEHVVTSQSGGSGGKRRIARGEETHGVARKLLVCFAALSLAALAACFIDVDYSGTRYRCTDTRECPPGYVCVAGYCEAGSTDASVDASLDASVTDADTTWDGAPPSDGAPDAAPPLPVGDLITLSFDDVRFAVVPNRAGNGIPAVRHGSISVSDESVYGKAIHFTGGGLFLPKDPALFAGNQVTIEAWVYRDSIATEDTVFSDRDNTFSPAATYHLSLYADDGGARFVTNDACSTDLGVTATATLVPAQTWTHIAVAWDGDHARFYVNGTLTDNLALVATPCLAGIRGFRVGMRADDSKPFNGYIDELKLSDYRKARPDILASMDFDTTALIGVCGDMIAEDGEGCDLTSACCEASTCEFWGDDTACGAGTCQAGACTGSGGRVTDGLVALYEFDETSGTTVSDTSGVEPALDLTIADELAVSRTAGVLSIDSPTIVASAGPASKIATACEATDELTVEAWVAPANTTQEGPARIVTMSEDTNLRNFQLGQEQTCYHARVRSLLSDDNGGPYIVSRTGDLDTSLAHVVVTRSSDGLRTLYVNGVPRAINFVRGDFSSWDSSFPLKLADELGTGERAWLGAYHLVAIYDRALSAEEVGRNFSAGAD